MTWEIKLPGQNGVLTMRMDAEGELAVTMRVGDDTVGVLCVEDLPVAHLFCKRATDLVEQDIHRLGQHNSTLNMVRGVARQLISLLDAGELDAVRATLERYAVPENQQ